MVIHIQRREFIALIGGAAVAWPLAARAQQSAMPVVGLLSSNAPDLLQAFRQGLKDTGYAERENMASGAVTAWPLTSRAQQGGPVRRIGALSGLPAKLNYCPISPVAVLF
jgi:hypothetical protein